MMEKVQGTRHKAQGTRHKAQGTRKNKGIKVLSLQSDQCQMNNDKFLIV